MTVGRPQRRVLIVDDEPALRTLALAALRPHFDVVAASDGEEAWRLAREAPPAVAVIDVQMPGLNGLDLVRRFRAHPDSALRDARVVLLTCHAQETERAAGLAAGADIYLTKPFSPAGLAAVLQVLLASPAAEAQAHPPGRPASAA